MSWVLRKLAADANAALELGKAAEYLVCADLILAGYRAYPSDQGLPYDVVADVAGRLWRIQVKATCFSRNVNKAGRRERVAYSWGVRYRGRGRKGHRLAAEHCDLVAFVALDIRKVAYVPLAICGQTMQLLPPGAEHKTKFRSGRQWARAVDEFPFAEAISGDLSVYKAGLRQLTHCVHGHEYTPENTYVGKNGRVCRQCIRRHSHGQWVKRKREGANGAAEVGL